jgi:hypothetical protein
MYGLCRESAARTKSASRFNIENLNISDTTPVLAPRIEYGGKCKSDEKNLLETPGLQRFPREDNHLQTRSLPQHKARGNTSSRDLFLDHA